MAKEENNLCKITMEDENKNSVTVFVHRDATISEWIEAFRKILRFQEFNQENITAYLGD